MNIGVHLLNKAEITTSMQQLLGGSVILKKNTVDFIVKLTSFVRSIIYLHAKHHMAQICWLLHSFC